MDKDQEEIIRLQRQIDWIKMRQVMRDMNKTNINREQIDDMMTYHAWDDQKILKGKLVRDALSNALEVIFENVPESPDRWSAIRKIREARMDCNSAITHDGKY